MKRKRTKDTSNLSAKDVKRGSQWFRSSDLHFQRMLEIERAKFLRRYGTEKLKLHISYGFSELDPFTNVAFTWDLWLKFPFKVPKSKCEKFKELIQDAFQKVFVS